MNIDEKRIVDWINSERKRFNLSPINKIHKGKNNTGFYCPIAKSLSYKSNKKIYVGTDWWNWTKSSYLPLPRSTAIMLPPEIARFIEKFDRGLLPQYQQRISRKVSPGT